MTTRFRTHDERLSDFGGTPYGPSHGKYVIVWRRTPQGWRMHLDMWNNRPRT